ncbi:MAG TPA: alpha/beta hydrolase-fold protein, partial [Fimbriimonadaceae bacterium]|nr:alpha/beta hydrolase-fold protein [Fimbriimonadaceae bacterium]
MMLLLVSLLAVTASSEPSAQPLVSPEVHADHTVTFRFADANAKKVQIGIEGLDAAPMTKGAGGVWTYTSGALMPDIYGYAISADGQTRLDPNNPLTKPNLIWPSNMFLVPGAPPEAWEVQNVPHGAVHHHLYHSQVIGDDRDYYVYTPPGYESTRAKLPVLYLLHGYSDMANGWTAVGKANVILDNLMAAGQVKPMVVVMTLGYGVPDFAKPGGRAFGDRSLTKRNYDGYRDALFQEVMPAIAKGYRISSDRNSTAIAGLSMGGAESLYVGLNHLEKFAWIGAFSSGGLGENFDEVFPGVGGAPTNRKLKKLFVSCGTSDGLITFNRHLVAWLNQKKINNTAVESSGRHAWMVWRRNLIAFT